MKKFKQTLKKLLIGENLEGEDIINKEVKFKTVYPKDSCSFNEVFENNRKQLTNSKQNQNDK